MNYLRINHYCCFVIWCIFSPCLQSQLNCMIVLVTQLHPSSQLQKLKFFSSQQFIRVNLQQHMKLQTAPIWFLNCGFICKRIKPNVLTCHFLWWKWKKQYNAVVLCSGLLVPAATFSSTSLLQNCHIIIIIPLLVHLWCIICSLITPGNVQMHNMP